MRKHHVVAMIGTLALLANFLVPGLAFGQPAPENQQGQINVGCPTGGTLGWGATQPADVTFDAVASSTSAQSSLDHAVSQAPTGNLLPSANVLSVSDTRSGGVDNCPLATSGFTVSVQGSNLVGQGAAAGNTIDGNSIRLITSGNFDGATSYAYNAPSVAFSSVSGPGNQIGGNTSTPVHQVTAFKTIATYSSGAQLGDSAPSTPIVTTILQRTSPTNSTVYIATGIAIVDGILANQYPGTYQGQITYTLVAS